MGFLDNAISKTKEAFEVARKKTGEVVAVEKQKFDVSSLKSKRERDFATLGKIYFREIEYQDDIDEDVKKLVNSIKEKNDEIERINKEIRNAKNKKICPGCGASIDASSVFCNSCGEKVV